MSFSVVGIGIDESLVEVPKITCKGEGAVAQKILSIARQHSIPVIEHPDLVDALRQLEDDDEIPREVFEAVAIIVVELAKESKTPARKPTSN